MPRTPSLGQVVAADAQARSITNKETAKLDKAAQKHDLFSGFSKVYTPMQHQEEGGAPVMVYPPETKLVQFRANELLGQYLGEYREAIDLAASKDAANCSAFADIIVDGNVLVPHVPATHLLHLEKVLDDISTFVLHLPVRPADEVWHADDGHDGLWKTDPKDQFRHDTVWFSLVLIPPGEHTQGQAQPMQRQEPTGTWATTKYSGALTENRKRELLRNVATLKTAVKTAREEANRVEAPAVKEADKLFKFILG